MAVSYDLEVPSERERSVNALRRLFFRLVQDQQPDLFVEAGAKTANTSRRAVCRLESARVVAFEANPYTYAKYHAKNPSDTGVEYLHLALSDAPGEVTFNVRRSSDGAPRPDGHGSMLKRVGEYPYDFETVTVEATTLDIFFADTPVDRCAMWIDVEGASQAVLRGAERLLDRTVVLHIEVEDREFWQDAWTTSQLVGHLLGRGFVPVARDFEFKHQHNVVFVREELLDDHQVRYRLTQHFSAAARRSEEDDC
jgi:FkbM family methyltransferase